MKFSQSNNEWSCWYEGGEIEGTKEEKPFDWREVEYIILGGIK